MNEIQRFFRHSGGLPKYRNPKILSALGWASEVQKSKDSFGTRVGFRSTEIQRFFRHSGGLPKYRNPKIRRLSGDFRRMEKWKKPSFVGRASEFRRTKKNQDSFGGLPNSEDQKRTKIRFGIQFLSVGYMGSTFGWALDIWISVHGFWIYGFRLSVSTFGWALDIWVSYEVSTFGWALDIWVRLSVGLWIYGFLSALGHLDI
ncbi:unnamed protein product [Rhizophagus irregularis]|nr:unnamed protein product [Rhizophagus irregularis]